ncbi:MAG TPA: vWA domain-containing protein, partial [Lacipirellulaceae bacterium]
MLLVALMLLREWRTQVIIVTATDYSLPAPLNPWAVEDGNALKELQQENLTPVTDITDKWRAQPNLATLLQLLEEEIEQTRAPLIVYISMHGIVNDERMPCLLPPGVGPAETTKLLPVRPILEHISQLAAARDALVILDCNRFRASWNLGIVYNTFTERLQEVLKSNPVSKVAVLCSAGPGQVNWASGDLQGSSFGRYLQLGLAGAADSGESANGDGKVSLHELVTYLQREVNAWSEFNRGESHKPTLASGAIEDFHVAYSVRDGETLEGLVSKFYAQQRAEPEKRTEIAALWAKLDKLRSQELVRQDPLACRDFEFGLLRLEELWQGGSAYRQSAEDELILLKDKLARAVARKDEVADSRSVSDHLGLGTIGVAAHTLPLAEYFGACDAQLSERIGQLWKKPANLAVNVPLDNATDEPELETARHLAEMQLLLAAQNQGVTSLWQTQDPLTSALKLRDRAEKFAVPRGPKGLPGDERAHYFARHALNAADARRRLVEDALFIGPRSGQDFAELVTEAVELYEKANAVMQEATAAYAVRDTALAEAPYLGWWLCGPASLEVPDRNALISELIELIRQSRALNQAITSPEKLADRGASPESSGLAFQHLTSAALKHHQTLKDAFKRKCEDLLGAGSQGTAGWTALDSALRTPLIPANQRGVLLAKRDDVSEQLFSRYSETKQAAHEALAGNNTDEKISVAGSDSIATYLEAMQSWDSHPLLEILPGKNFEAAKRNLDWCDDVAMHLRGRLARLPSYEDDGEGATERPGDDIFGDRQQLSRAESELRASASLGFGLDGIKVDPIIALREFDLRALLAWHGERAMEDFWGDETGLDDPFFVRAAKHYFDAASNLGTPTPAFQPHIRGLKDRLAQLEKAKRERVQLQATPTLVDEESGDVEVQIDVSATRASYPAGQAAIYLRNEESRQRFKIDPASATNTFFEYPATSAAKNYVIAIRSAPRDQPRAEAVSFFRGQEVTDPFEMPTFEGVRIVYAPHNYVSQTITLSGDDPEQLSLVFILDCSHSMAAASKVRAEGADVKQRLALAKGAFIAMLSDIANRNAAGENTRVGVRFFGHRLGWSPAPSDPPPQGWSSKLMTNERYRGRKPEKPHPAVDVELVQPLGAFDEGVAGDITELLKSIVPHGETALYLSLLQALDDFNSEDSETRKSIIAITDGQDYQYPHPDFPPPIQISLRRLRTEYENRGLKIPIHILGFDLSPDEAETAQKAYDEIARFSGGSYTKIGSGRELLEHLREHLNVDGYIVNSLPL